MKKTLLLFFSLMISSVASGSGYVWEITNARSKAYLIGTFHAATPDFKVDINTLKPLLHESNELVLEADINDKNDIKSILSLSKSDHPQLSVFTEKERKELYALCLELDLNFIELSTRKLWWISSQIREATNRTDGLQFENGVDYQLSMLAKNIGIRIRGIETIKSQIARRDRLPASLHANLLRETISKSSSSDRQMRRQVQTRLQDGWKKGDSALPMDNVRELWPKEGAQLVAIQAMMEGRNTLMAGAIQKHMELGGTATFAFGLYHFIGPDNVLEHLRKSGYKVTPIQLKP
jgi:uncharacterized protein